MAIIRNPYFMPELNYNPTHKEVVQRISNWYKNSKRATVVFTELVTTQRENPDVIAWFNNGHSVMIECKVSRSDFMADKKKPFRYYEDYGVGDKRYFAVPKGLIKPDEVPEGWGLLYVLKHSIREILEPINKSSNKQAECSMLISALRRVQISTAVYVVQDIIDKE